MVWTLVDNSPSPNRVFTRPLDNNELGFFYDATFNGVADIAEHYIVETTRDSLFELSNVTRTWIALKRIFPLLGATTRETDREALGASFTIVEADLDVTRPGEVSILSATSEEEVHEFVEDLLSGPRQLSPDLLSRVYIYSRKDSPGLYHAVIHTAHSIIDGTASLSLIRTFFDILSLPPTTHIPHLEERLALCVGSENLNPHRDLPLARRRWRRAIGWVIHHIRNPKIQGGMSIPRRITTHTPYRLPKSKRLEITFPEEESTLIIANCRKYGTTFGAALPILGQLGSSRLLHRRYIRGEIGKDEWEWRRIQPCNTMGPLNYRPYLYKDWYTNGGSEVVVLGINYFFLAHSFMPSVSDEWVANNRHTLEDGAPPFSALLSQGRFVLRSNVIKQKVKEFVAHPLLFEIASFRFPGRILYRKRAGRLWMENREGGELGEPEKDVPSVLTNDLIYHNGGASLGNIDPLRPTEYPVLPSSPLSSQKYYPQPKTDENVLAGKPAIRVIDSWRKLCTRPAELYFGSLTQSKKLTMFVSWDGNTYEDSVVEEWLKEAKLATHHYLCQPL
ncbi:hypothetical protein BJ322DRAFT_1115390 [Thelephora terrestris]|uniref:Uncharacterized protein n=1 Tax=Thelephora terrestris TaxID=56493 RepID=A0A9P6LBS5_9AGAM|nr:hypothetical protein BJ322DRAFT_1115390 [Thelephora terrestris]